MNETDAKVSAAAEAGDFNPEQKRYLEGFVAGAQIARAVKSVGGTGSAGAAVGEPTGPDAAGLKAQNRLIASGGKLSDQEKFKRDQHPFDTYGRLKDHAAKGEYPKPPDNFDRTKARLKYVLDAMGVEKFVGVLEEKLGRKLDRAVLGAVAPRPAFDRTAHIGVHAQKQQGLNWIGLVVPVGRLSVAQMRGLAQISRDFGDGDLRLTVWQNLLISGVASERLADATARIEALGLAISASAVRSGLVACTGNTGCKFAASDTKRHAEEIALWCDRRVALDTPVNIHLTGCHHSCAQHYVSEIGLLACKVQANEDADPVEGYHIYVGGGFGPNAALGRELYRDVVADDVPRTVGRILKAYLAHRASRDEDFLAFSRRHEIDALKAMSEFEAAE